MTSKFTEERFFVEKYTWWRKTWNFVTLCKVSSQRYFIIIWPIKYSQAQILNRKIKLTFERENNSKRQNPTQEQKTAEDRHSEKDPHPKRASKMYCFVSQLSQIEAFVFKLKLKRPNTSYITRFFYHLLLLFGLKVIHTQYKNSNCTVLQIKKSFLLNEILNFKNRSQIFCSNK